MSDVILSKFESLPDSIADKSMSARKPPYPAAQTSSDPQRRDTSNLSQFQVSCSNSLSDEASNQDGHVATEDRYNKILHFWKKKSNRNSQKKVRYGCRQNLANQRFRHQGRFIKREELEKLDPMDIFDPVMRSVPKTKNIFKITKEPRNGSSHSTSSAPLLCGETQKREYLKLIGSNEAHPSNIARLPQPLAAAAQQIHVLSAVNDNLMRTAYENKAFNILEPLFEFQAQADRTNLFSTELPRHLVMMSDMPPQLMNQPTITDDVYMSGVPSLFAGESYEF